jgi:TPR repeat protein
VTADLAAARDWYHRAALKNQPSAQLALGDLIRETASTGEALAEAVHWYEAAAQAGLPRASLSLGAMYEAGAGVARDPERAQACYRRAAGAGLAEAEAALRRLGASPSVADNPSPYATAG